MLKNLVKKYNKYNEDKLPHITPHILRHTFCTNYANEGMNPKALQYIMGHANITMTLNYYAHATFDSAMAEVKRLEKGKQQEQIAARSEEHTSELQSRGHLVCRLLLEKKKKI